MEVQQPGFICSGIGFGHFLKLAYKVLDLFGLRVLNCLELMDKGLSLRYQHQSFKDLCQLVCLSVYAYCLKESSPNSGGSVALATKPTEFRELPLHRLLV